MLKDFLTKIIYHCVLLDLLEEGDGMMANRGFDIADGLERRGASLVMPTFLQGQDQFTDEHVFKKWSPMVAIFIHVINHSRPCTASY